MNIYILGAGPFAKVVVNAVHQVRGNLDRKLVGFVVDPEYYEEGREIYGLPVMSVETIGTFEDTSQNYMVSGTVWPQRRRMVEILKRRGFKSLATVHPHAWCHIEASVNGGSFVNAGAVIDRGTVVGEHVIVNRGALIGHDVKIGECATIGPGANLCGNVYVGPGTIIGAGAVVREGVSIGHHATVGMGAVVTKDVPACQTWYGVPAKPVFNGLEKAITTGKFA